MKLPEVNEVKTAGEAEQLAIDWQNWQSEQSLTAMDTWNWADTFEKLAVKFPELKDEFKENGII